MNLQHIVVASDLTTLARSAYAHAAVVARASGARLTVLHADTKTGAHFDDLAGFAGYREQVHARLHDKVLEVTADLERMGVEARITILPGPVVQVIDAYLHEVPTDLVVMARPMHHELLELLRSTTTGVLRSSPVPVLVVPVSSERVEHGLPSIRRVAVTTDLSAETLPGLRYAADLAVLFGSTTDALHALDEGATTPTGAPGATVAADARDVEVLKNRTETLLNEHIAASGRRFEAQVVTGRSPAKALVGGAFDRDIDLLVVPSKGKGRFARLVLGSTSEQVVSTAPMPVLVVPPAWTSGAVAPAGAKPDLEAQDVAG